MTYLPGIIDFEKTFQATELGAGIFTFYAGTDEHGLKIQKASRKHFGMAGREKDSGVPVDLFFKKMYALIICV